MLLSDRDPKFLGELWKEVFLLLGVKLLFATPYHPSVDGQSERTNQTVERALRFQIHSMPDPRRWIEALPHIYSILNNSVSSTTGKTLNEIYYGMPLHKLLDLLKPIPALDDSTANLARIEARDAVD